MGNDIFYSLSTDDIRTVAIQEFDTELSDFEIEKVTNEVAKRIDWYEVICDSISAI